MDQNEQLKDWTFRYQYIYRLRRTNKQKQRFLSALVADIAKIREDIQVIEYKQNKKHVSSNLYVGNIETADQIICTYYDTPPMSLGSYYLFDRKKQGKSVTGFILITSLMFLLAGLVLTLAYMKNSVNTFDFTSISTLFVIACYGIYFYLFSKVTKGLSNRNNLVRNTSSILSLLVLMNTLKNKRIAFAFVDEGCFGELGLNVLRDSCKKSAKIYSLDCVGADAELHFRGSGIPIGKLKEFTVHSEQANQINYIFGANTAESDEGNQYYLEKKDLNKKTIKIENLKKIIEIFQ